MIRGMAAGCTAAILLYAPAAVAGQSAAIAAYGAGTFLALVVGSALAGHADPTGDYDRGGLYLGGSASLAFDLFEDEFKEVAGSDGSVDESLGASVKVGYRLNPRFAGEVEFEWLSGFDLLVDGSKAGEIESWIATGNAKGYLLTGSIQPFLLVGGGVMQAKGGTGRATDIAWRFGGGLEMYVSRRFVLTVDADYVLPIFDLEDLDYISMGVGFQYRF